MGSKSAIDHEGLVAVVSDPQRIQRKRIKGWRMPEGAVYVGRPSKWGNPYCTCTRDCWHMPVGSPERAVELFKRAVAENDIGGRFHRECPTSADIRDGLAGKDLACWCALDQPCHADVLLEIANVTAQPMDGRCEP